MIIREKDTTQLNSCNAFMARFSGYYAEKDGRIIWAFVSYNTVIGVRIDNSVIFTKYSYSKTTVQHKYKFMRKYGGHMVDHSEFVNVCKSIGLNCNYNGYNGYIDIDEY